ncbi:TonB-dependent receptor [Exilibacterium tricleocarpae]|uniref:TonB-dependent receptor n=1 Tax=Exilibacterium tricleocarpae TaxID=2591008 RepID=A0A545U3E2_9GAMM|nr:TonB-dependent receptor [Exilibacterium tricleocarpae]TQV83991.1 TonB-dependent receptor [Exilibacterium tricleocarpae]
MKNTAFATLALTALPFALHADVADKGVENKLEEIVVISSRIAMPLRQVGTSVSVLDAAAIDARGFNSLADVLRTLPAVAVSSNGGIGKPTSLRVRGEEGFRTLVLIDGMDISDPTAPRVGPQAQHLLSAGIDRVEVLRGAQGMMYGADAGGVINITTRRGAQNLEGNVDVEAGRYGSRKLAGTVSGGSDALDFFIAAADFSLDGFNARDTDTVLRDDDGYDNTTVHGRLGWTVTDQLRLEGVVRDVAGTNEYDSCSATTDDCSDDYDQTSLRLTARYEGEVFNHEFAVENNEVETAFFTAGTRTFGNDGNTRRVEYLGDTELGNGDALIYGIEHEQQTLDGDSGDRERDQLGYYVEYQSNLYQNNYGDALFVTLGVRHDDNDDFGEHTSYRTTAAYLTALDNGATLKWKASYGTGFRAPSLSEIDINANADREPASLVVLEEETSRGFDLGVEYFGSGGLHLEAVYFDQQVEDEIQFDLATFSGYIQDPGRSESTGVELSADFPLGTRWTLSANYTYNDTETAGDTLRVQRPRHLANLLAAYDNGNWGWGFNLRSARDAVDSSADLDDYEVVTINARYRFSEALEVYGRVENAFGEDYQEIVTYNTADTAGYVGVRLNY